MKRHLVIAGSVVGLAMPVLGQAFHAGELGSLLADCHITHPPRGRHA